MLRHQPEHTDAPRPARMTEEEAHEVIALWTAQQEVTADAPSVQDVAEGLGVPDAQVQELLAQVRARRQAEERRLAEQRQRLEQERQALQEERRVLNTTHRQVVTVRQQRKAARRSRVANRLSDIVGVGLLAVVLGALTLVTCAWTFMTVFIPISLLGSWKNPRVSSSDILLGFLCFLAVDVGVISLTVQCWKEAFRELRAKRGRKKQV